MKRAIGYEIVRLPQILIMGRYFYTPKEAAKFYSDYSTRVWVSLQRDKPDPNRERPYCYTEDELTEKRRRLSKSKEYQKRLYKRVYKVFKAALEK
jgi:hypothetical protein